MNDETTAAVVIPNKPQLYPIIKNRKNVHMDIIKIYSKRCLLKRGKNNGWSSVKIGRKKQKMELEQKFLKVLKNLQKFQSITVKK